MEVALLTRDARIALAACALGLGLVAALLRWRRAPERWLVPAVALALAAALTLGVERAVALMAHRGAPADAAFNEWRWVLLSPWGLGGIAAGFAVAVATIGLAWRGTRRERSLARRVLHTGLRGGACGAALVLFLEPAVELRRVRREPNHVVVLVDDSRSMGLAETPGGPTRAARAAALVAASAPTFERWRAEHRVDFFTFSDTVLPGSEDALARAVPPRADATLMAEALETVRATLEGPDLAGVVLVSDGVPTGRFADGVAGGAARDLLEGLHARVHTAWVGRRGLRDVAIARVDADEFAFVRTVTRVEAVVRATGVPRQTLPVVLRRDGRELRRTVVEVGGDLPEVRVPFEFTPERVGKYIYEISVPVAPEEAVTTNNARTFVVRVIREKIRALLVAGRPSWDERAVRGLLKADPNVDLISFFILRTWDDVQLVEDDEMSLIPFPTAELFEDELGSFDVLIFMNFEHGPYRIGPYLDNVRRFVEDGGGLTVIGGDLAFSSGRYGGTPLAEVLPVELIADGAPPASLLATDEFRPRLTPEGRRHPVTQLRFDRRDNEARWNGLPALEGQNLVAGSRPGASTLAVHPQAKTSAGDPMPVIVAGDFGRGRTVVALTDTLWRWGFVAAGRPGDDGRAFAKLWENTIRWLIHDPEFEFLQVEAEQTRFAPGERPRLRARLVNADYLPFAGADLTVAVTRSVDDGRREPVEEQKLATDEAGEVHVELSPPGPGAYRIAARAKVGGRAVEAEDVFLVDPEHAELERPEASEETLQAIAGSTGGRHLGPAESLPASLPFAPPRIVRVEQRTDVELWSRPTLLLLALALLGSEWALRRRRGYL